MRSSRLHPAFWLLTAFVVMVVLAAAAWPVFAVVLGSRAGRASLGVDVGLLAGSVGVAVLIAGLAAVIALPGAWLARSSRATTLVVLMAPMLLPSYLAYTGWGIIRAPDTAIGRWLMMGPGGAGGDANWYPRAASCLLAVGGLVLWSWPLAALLVGVRMRRIDDSVIDSLRMDVGASWRRGVEVLWMCGRAVGFAIGVVMLVMLGSAVPLHLAQLDTYAIRTWRLLDQTPHPEQWRVWLGAWPLMLIAAAAAGVTARRLTRLDVQDPAPAVARNRAAPRLAAGAVWVLAIVVPVLLIVFNVRNWHQAGTFARLIEGPLLTTLAVAACIALVTVGIAVWMWMAISSTRAVALGKVVAAVLLLTGLMPGILIGAATARAWSGVSLIGDSSLAVVLAHTARFGMIGVLTGWWLAATEGRWHRDLRELDAGSSLGGWWRASLSPQAGALAAAGIAAGILSVHEIESTVLVQPASSAGGSFSWQMLQWLHFARMDELAMGVLIVVGLGFLAGGAIILCLRLRNRG